MRQPRIYAPEDLEVAYYHCVSRVVDRRRVMGPVEKEQFRELMRFYERFSCVRVVTYCLMDNHFHLLVEVPRRPDEAPSEQWIVDHVGRCYGSAERADLVNRLDQLRKAGALAEVEAVLDGYRERLWNISAFLKTLKQRFTQWFNRRHDRTGTLWEGRFGSTLIEGGGTALESVAAYIDLNPVRAGVVDDPAAYRWCGYAEALAGAGRGRRRAVEGIAVAASTAAIEPSCGSSRRGDGGNRILETYRAVLFGRSETRGGPDDPAAAASSGRARRRRIDPERIEAVLESGGRLSRVELLRCRIRYFTQGVAVGGRSFVERVFLDSRRCFGPARSSGARPMHDAEALGLFSLRQLGGAVEPPARRV